MVITCALLIFPTDFEGAPHIRPGTQRPHLRGLQHSAVRGGGRRGVDRALSHINLCCAGVGANVTSSRRRGTELMAWRAATLGLGSELNPNTPAASAASEPMASYTDWFITTHLIIFGLNLALAYNNKPNVYSPALLLVIFLNYGVWRAAAVGRRRREGALSTGRIRPRGQRCDSTGAPQYEIAAGLPFSTACGTALHFGTCH